MNWGVIKMYQLVESGFYYSDIFTTREDAEQTLRDILACNPEADMEDFIIIEVF